MPRDTASATTPGSRRWPHAEASPALIVGLYLVLACLARFAEESYRGEPTTPVVAGLRLYQWFALLGALAGVSVMAVRPATEPPGPDPSWIAPATGVLVALAYWMAMGADFPESNRRFSRLA